MLVLTRKVGESIRIDGRICITVMEVDGRTIKLGIDAPRNVPIHREEVWLRILEENRLAAAAEAADIDLGSMADLLKQGGLTKPEEKPKTEPGKKPDGKK